MASDTCWKDRWGTGERQAEVLGRSKAERELLEECAAFAAAAEALLGGMLQDKKRIDDALTGVDPMLMDWATFRLADLAVSALARDRGTTPEAVLRALVAQACDDARYRAIRSAQG
jgi:hypothetical protein